MPPPTASALADWSRRVRDVLTRYDEDLLRAVAQKLVRPRNQWPIDELIERSLETLSNAPVLDRRFKELPPSARKLLSWIGLSRRPRWRVGHLLTLCATLGHPEGLTPILTLLESGLLFPDAAEGKVRAFDEWLGANGLTHAHVFAHPFGAGRCRPESWELPTFEPVAEGSGRLPDGLEWPLRIGAVWQQVGAIPLRLTQQRTLFKRDLIRLQADAMLNAAFLDQPEPIVDAAVLALELARGAGLFREADAELRVDAFPDEWETGLYPTLASLWSAIFAIEDWDPSDGALTDVEKPRTLPSVAAGVFLLLANQPDDIWVSPQALAHWLWERHPAWSAAVTRHDDRGEAWVQALLLGVAYQLQIVESLDGFVRLSPLGRHLLSGKPEPPPPPEFRQTLTVQPNNEIVAYRQGLTPRLIGRLSRFAAWKTLSAACMLELTAEQVYFGLESGLTQQDIVQTLTQHGMRAVPPTVLDAINRWSNKRERITLYAAATLMEFANSGDLDAAVSRGLVTERLTDRIGLVPGDQALDLKHLRQIGNRDYEARPQRCITFDDDGVRFTVDASASDLLLEAELARIAESLGSSNLAHRQYRLTVESLRRADSEGMSLPDLEQWFLDRTGHEITAAARLLFPTRLSPPPADVARKLVLTLASEEVTDGVWQWPDSRQYLEDRVGPVTLIVREGAFEDLRKVLASVGLVIDAV